MHQYGAQVSTEFVDVSGNGIVIVGFLACMAVALVEGGKLAQRLHQHGQRARIALALGRLLFG